MKKDKLRSYLQNVQEGYILAATPATNRIYDMQGNPTISQDREDEAISASRARLLMVGIDIKYIVQNFLAKLAEDHGYKRAERLKNYLIHGYLEKFYWENRRQILSDKRRLENIIYWYRR